MAVAIHKPIDVTALDSILLRVQLEAMVANWQSSTTFEKAALESNLRKLESQYAICIGTPYHWMTSEDQTIRERVRLQYEIKE